MPSVNKTENYGLNQWTGNEYPKRIDFVQDNLIVDGVLKEHENAIEANKTQLEQLETDLTELSTTATNTQQAVEEHYDYFTQQISTITATGIPKLVTIPLVVTATTDNQKVFQIPYDYYDKATDTLLVFQDGLFLPPTYFSSIGATETGGVVTRGNLTLVNGVVSGTLLPIVILKNVPVGTTGSINGTVLAQNTIPLDRLIGLAAAYIEKGNDYRPNLLINGDAQIAQRGTSFTITTSQAKYTLDRWCCYHDGTGCSVTVSQQYDATIWNFLRSQCTVAGSSVNYNYIEQRLEDVTKITGKVIISFYAKADTARTITPYIKQWFGSGGSAQVFTAGSAITLSTSWTKHTVTIDVPTWQGKSISGDHYTSLLFALPINTTYTIDITKIKLEQNDHATPFIPRSYRTELQDCQRYYVGAAYGGLPIAVNVDSIYYYIALPVTMRANSTINGADLYWNTGGLITGYTLTTGDTKSNGVIMAIIKTAHGINVNTHIDIFGIDAEL